MIARPSMGGRKPVITPVTRAEDFAADCSTTVESRSWPGERVAHLHVVGGDAGADDGPVAVAAGVHQPVEVDLQVGAVEVADAEMHDAGREVGAGVGGARHAGRELGQRLQRKGNGHRRTSSGFSLLHMARPLPSKRWMRSGFGVR